MKIIRTYPFWVWLMRLAYRKIKIAQPTITVGVPGIRDPNAKCPMYAPRKRVTDDVANECETDGHYLCKECAFNINYNENLRGKQVNTK